METTVLDVRAMPPRERHPKIFETFERAGAFTWKYLEEGPEVWRVEIGKTK